jgi:hypothetical protein
MVRQAIDDAILLRSCDGEECESPSIPFRRSMPRSSG